jgi:hypothetical protein
LKFGCVLTKADLSWHLTMPFWNLAFLWLVPALQFALVVVFWNRGVFIRMFPAFFRYSCYAVVANILPFLFIDQQIWYFWAYWIIQLIYGVLAMLVMREVFQAVWDMKQGNRRFLVWALILTLAVAAALWGVFHPVGRGIASAMVAGFGAFLAGVHLVEVVLCCLTLWMVSRFTQYHVGIMLGFAGSAAVAVLAYVGRYFHPGPVFKEVILYAPISAYLASTIMWLLTFLSRPKLTRKLDPAAALELMRQQEKLAQELSSGLGLKWPGKKGDDDSKNQCAVHA